MTSVPGVSMPRIGVQRNELTSPKNLALGGIAAASIVAGGIVGALRGNPLAGLGIGAAIAATALGAALLGNASASQRDGYCDYSGDVDCDYPGTGRYSSRDDYYPPTYDPTPYYPRDDYPSSDYRYYPGGATGRGDD